MAYSNAVLLRAKARLEEDNRKKQAEYQAHLANVYSRRPRVREIDREYVGMEPDPPALSSWTLRAVYSTRAKTIRIVNMNEPDAFRAIRERLEAFSKNQLGVWALQYSRDKLVELAEDGDLKCGCREGETARYDFEFRGDAVRIFCHTCGYETFVPMASTLAANAFLHTDRLILEPPGEKT